MLDRRIGTSQSPIHKAGYTPFIPPDLLLEAMETGVPYRPQLIWVEQTNPIANMAGDAPRVYLSLIHICLLRRAKRLPAGLPECAGGGLRG